MTKAQKRVREEILTSVIREFGFEHPFTIATARMIESESITTGQIITLVRLRRKMEENDLAENED